MTLTIIVGLLLFSAYNLAVARLYGRVATSFLDATLAYNRGDIVEGARLHAEGKRRRQTAERYDLYTRRHRTKGTS